MRDEGGGLSRGRPERTHLPAIIFALRIIIASCVDGTWFWTMLVVSGLAPQERRDKRSAAKQLGSDNHDDTSNVPTRRGPSKIWQKA